MRAAFLLAFATTIAVWCSDSDSEPASSSAVLALGTGFSHDSVVVRVDREAWFDGVATTDSLSGLAWVGQSRHVYASLHTLSVSVRSNGVALSSTFTPSTATTIFVRYHRSQGTLSVEYQSGLLQQQVQTSPQL